MLLYLCMYMSRPVIIVAIILKTFRLQSFLSSPYCLHDQNFIYQSSVSFVLYKYLYALVQWITKYGMSCLFKSVLHPRYIGTLTDIDTFIRRNTFYKYFYKKSCQYNLLKVHTEAHVLQPKQIHVWILQPCIVYSHL